MQSFVSRFLTAAVVATALCASGAALAQKVRLATSAGDIVVELDAAKSPKTVANFLDYVKAGHYEGTIFHRVIENFMIQGGGMTTDMKEKPTRAPIGLESRNGLTNQRGTIAMARTADPNSATAQFFINVSKNDFLNYPGQDGHGYTVFGKVVEGMDVVNKIVAVPTGNQGGHQNVPRTPVTIESATQDGVWVAHWKGRDFLALGTDFTLVTPGRAPMRAASL
jgi:peptidyl-prolyl cis-trans isomerase A (cyclophilin A)